MARWGSGFSEAALARVKERVGSGSGVVRRRVCAVRKASFLETIVGAWAIMG